MKRIKKVFTYMMILMMTAAMINPMAVEAASKVKLSKKKATISTGKTVTLKVTGTKKKVKWSTSNKKVATVKKGVVKGVKAGTATITARVSNKKLTCKVTVKPALNKTKTSLTMGETTKLTVKGKKSSKSKVSWTSSDTAIATVSKGVITGKKPGIVTIRAKVNSYTLKCTVTVLPTTEYVKPAYDTLRAKVLASPYTNEEGNKAIFIEEVMTENTEYGSSLKATSGFYIIYEEATGLFYFECLAEAEGTTAKLIMTLNPDTVCTQAQQIRFICNIEDPETQKTYDFSGTSTINVPTYDPIESIDFVFDKLSEMTEEDQLYFEEMAIDLLPDMYTMLAVLGWDATLSEKMELTLGDLGFTTYNFV